MPEEMNTAQEQIHQIVIAFKSKVWFYGTRKKHNIIFFVGEKMKVLVFCPVLCIFHLPTKRCHYNLPNSPCFSISLLPHHEICSW